MESRNRPVEKKRKKEKKEKKNMVWINSPQQGVAGVGRGVPQGGVTRHPVGPHLNTGDELVQVFVENLTVGRLQVLAE